VQGFFQVTPHPTAQAAAFATQPAVALNLLVLQANKPERDALTALLKRLGHRVQGVSSTQACQAEFDRQRYDILILDPDLPLANGLDFAALLRAEYPGIGIIVLTTRARLDDRLAGYRSGADLYLTRPTSSEELAAAIRALSRRSSDGDLPQVSASTQDRLTLNTATLQLLGANSAVDVSDTELSVLTAFTRSSGQRLGTAQVIAASGKALSKSTLEVMVVRLRRKLEQAGATAPTIKAIRGMGYQLCVPLELRLPTYSTNPPQHA
jgi:DNA-binding response OmpR family regulator